MRGKLEERARAAASTWDAFWFKPVDTSTLALFRIAVGVLVLSWTLALAPSLYAFYSREGILPGYPDYQGSYAWSLLEWFPSDAAVTLFYFALLLASICLLVGFATRVAALIVFICMASFVHRNPWVLNSGDLLVQVQVTIIYIAAVWDKVRGTTWNDGTAVSYSLRIGDLERLPVPGFVTDSLILA